jgi:DNA invertase Pin-like site-specific DNA recombinase
MKAIAYLGGSLDPIEMQTQKQNIKAFAQSQQMDISRFFALSRHGPKTKRETKLDQLLQLLDQGDILVVSDLADFGHSIGEVLIIVDTLIRQGIRCIAVAQSIDSARSHYHLATQVTLSIFEQLAQMERELISRRTKQGLAKAVAKGKRLGRPKGSFSHSRLDSRRREIKKLLALGVSKASIAKITGVSQSALTYYIKSRKLA